MLGIIKQGKSFCFADFKKYWRSISVEKMTDQAIEQSLEKSGISSQAGEKKVFIVSISLCRRFFSKSFAYTELSFVSWETLCSQSHFIQFCSKH